MDTKSLKLTKISLMDNFQRRHPDLNRGIEVLQTSALPLGYAAILMVLGFGYLEYLPAEYPFYTNPVTLTNNSTVRWVL